MGNCCKHSEYFFDLSAYVARHGGAVRPEATPECSSDVLARVQDCPSQAGATSGVAGEDPYLARAHFFLRLTLFGNFPLLSK